jgi:hypothetical protein
MAVDKSALLNQAAPEQADVEIPGIGTVIVRGLTRAEVVRQRKASDTTALDGARQLEIERQMVAAGLVDPVMTVDEVANWQKVDTSGQIELVSTRIAELSGLLTTSEKDAYKSFRDDT